MSIILRVWMLVLSFALLYVVLQRVKKSGFEIVDSLFWILLSIILIIAAIIPTVVYKASAVFGFDSPSNFVFLCGIVVLLLKTFLQDQKICGLKRRLITLAQYEALHNKSDNSKNLDS